MSWPRCRALAVAVAKWLIDCIVLFLLMLGLLGLGGELVAAYQSQEKVTALGAWKEEHQRYEATQDAAIKGLSDSLQTHSLTTVQRIAVLETDVKSMSKEVTDLSNRVWYLIVGIAGLMLNVLQEAIRKLIQRSDVVRVKK